MSIPRKNETIEPLTRDGVTGYEEPAGSISDDQNAQKSPQISTNRTIRPPVKWHGGKHYLAPHIISCFPAHHTYVEPYGGAASVMLRKPPSPVEVYNDIDARLTQLFIVLRDHSAELQRRLTLTPYSEVEFDEALVSNSSDMIEQARVFFVRCRMSLGGRGDAFSYTKHRVRRGMADVVSGYLSTIDSELPKIIERLRCVQIIRRSAADVIHTWDSPDTLFYLDPPYPAQSRASAAVYDYEMNDLQHRELATLLGTVSGKVILSGYPCPLYEELYGGWRKQMFDIPNNAAGGPAKRRMVEGLWFNW